jgi:hypothetical protein
MNIEVFAICDAATDTQGKLNLLGAFDSIWAARVPVVHPHCAVALRIRFSRIEEGQHPIRINIVNEDGKNIVPSIDGNLNIKFGTDDESVAANLLINLQGFKLENYGSYSIDVAINGRHEGSLPLFVKRMPTPPGPPAPPTPIPPAEM